MVMIGSHSRPPPGRFAPSAQLPQTVSAFCAQVGGHGPMTVLGGGGAEDLCCMWCPTAARAAGPKRTGGIHTADLWGLDTGLGGEGKC